MTCISYSQYKKINPSSQIIIDGLCLEGCSNPNDLFSFEFNIYYTLNQNEMSSTNNIIWTELNAETYFVSGKNKFLFLKPNSFLKVN